MAFSVAVPTNDDNAEAKIAAQYATDPGASPDGHYVATDDAIMDASKYPDFRFFVVGNKHPNASTIGVGKDVMGGDGAGEMSATCYWGLELHKTQKVPIGLYHTSYRAADARVAQPVLHWNGRSDGTKLQDGIRADRTDGERPSWCRTRSRQ